MIETQFLSFFIVLLTAVVFSTFFTRFHISWVVALILGGIAVGPFGLDIFYPDDTILFMSEIGLIFLMFMAGLEVKLSNMKKNIVPVSFIGIANSIIPFGVGYLIGLLFGLTTPVSILIGITFVSASVAVVIPTLTSSNVLRTRIGNAIVGSIMVQDVISLVLLSIFFQTTSDISSLPLPVFYLFLFVILYFARKVLIRIEQWVAAKSDPTKQDKSFNQEFRVTILVLVMTVAIFEVLGLHPIIAGFFAGFVLSDTIKHEVLKEKIRAISYGLFIPIFFVVLGAQTDLSIFSQASQLGSSLTMILVIVLGAILSKLIGGFIAARFAGFPIQQSKLISVSSVAHLSTTLAVIAIASNIISVPTGIVTALVILSIVTTILSPILIKVVLKDKTT